MVELDLFLRNPQEIHAESPVEFLNDKAWGNIKTLSLAPLFHGLDREIETSSKRWKKYVESEAPESEKSPVSKTSQLHASLFKDFIFRENGKINRQYNDCVSFVLFDPIECFIH